MNMINRLAIQNTKGDMRERILSFVKRFTGLTRTRNELAHATWGYSADAYLSKTASIRLDGDFKQNGFVKVRPINQGRYNEIHAVVKELQAFNREIWAFLPELREYMRKPPEERQEEA